MVRINTNKSSIPELLHKRAQEGRGHVWHPNKIHSEKAWTCLKMESSATKVWFGQSKRATLFEGTCFKILLLIFCVFFRNSFPKLCGKVTQGTNNGWCTTWSFICDYLCISQTPPPLVARIFIAPGRATFLQGCSVEKYKINLGNPAQCPPLVKVKLRFLSKTMPRGRHKKYLGFVPT